MEKMKNNITEFIFKMRGGLWTLLFIIIFFNTKKTSLEIILISLILIIFGQLWRFWAAGSIKFYRGEKLRAENLTTWGPYALMRNPLYFGNFFIGLGWSIIAGLKAIIIFIICFYILYIKIIIPLEENFLFEKFGNEFLNWKNFTGRFFPKKISFENIKNIKGNFDFEILFKSEIHTLLTTLIGTCLIIIRSLCYT